jgi:hypothetical protein
MGRMLRPNPYERLDLCNWALYKYNFNTPCRCYLERIDG